MSAPVILCPVDFSDGSRAALRYGAVLAEHFGARLAVMTATDPLLAEAAAMETSAAGFAAATLDALRRFFSEAVDPRPGSGDITFDARIGGAAAEILGAAGAARADLIVISSHGLTGFRKMFFGSTTERVLRETRVPVLIVPGDDRGPVDLADAVRRVRRILTPVALSPAAERPLAVASGIASAIDAAVLLLHVVEPLRAVLTHGERYLPKVERERRLRAETELDAIAGAAATPRIERLIAYGEPSEEIVKVARDRGVGLIVMGLQSSTDAGGHVGSVTYRVLSAAGCPVLALPAAAEAGNFPRRGKYAASTGATRTRKTRIR